MSDLQQIGLMLCLAWVVIIALRITLSIKAPQGAQVARRVGRQASRAGQEVRCRCREGGLQPRGSY